MSYTLEDAMWDEAWDRISQELYPEHKKQAISEFTQERLQSFYLRNPEVILPSIKAFNEAKNLLANSPSASHVFFTTSIELALKASVLKPIVYGLVHHAALADAIVESALSQSGFDRYKSLISKLLSELAEIDIKSLKRHGSVNDILKEAEEVQKRRNGIIHRGESASIEDAEFARDVASTVLNEVVIGILTALKLCITENGQISNKIPD